MESVEVFWGRSPLGVLFPGGTTRVEPKPGDITLDRRGTPDIHPTDFNKINPKALAQLQAAGPFPEIFFENVPISPRRHRGLRRLGSRKRASRTRTHI